MEKLVSVIVPAYNVEKYLDRCIESLCTQSYKNIEIILVDDGSKDTTPAICDSWSKKDERIRVIHQQNQGQCAARNAALDVMNGNYLMFVDSDDYIRRDMIAKMVGMVEKNNLDFVRSAYMKVEESQNEEITDSEDTGAERFFDQRQIIENFLTAPYSKRKCFTAIMCCALYKASLFAEVRFPVGLIFEEGFVLPSVYLLTDRAGYIDESFYYYRSNADGTMASNALTEKSLKSIDDWMLIHQAFKDKYPEFNSITCNRWVSKYLKMLEGLTYNCDLDKDDCCKQKIIDTLKKNRDYFVEMGVDAGFVKEIDTLIISYDAWKKFKEKSKNVSLLSKIKAKLLRQ